MIAVIEKKNITNLEIPSGNEGGANEFWLPGGCTSGGVPEATMTFSTKPAFLEIKLKK